MSTLMRAARTAAAEAQRRGRMLQLAMEDGRTTTAERTATERIAAALAAHNLGMDGTIGRLVVDPSLEAHIVEIDSEGSVSQAGAPPFRCTTRRYNPAAAGAVTGDATYASFLSSMLDAGRRGGGLHFC